VWASPSHLSQSGVATPIVSLNMGDLTLEVNTLTNKLVMEEKDKPILQEELDKKLDF
jgi:hypothetical protein